MLQDVEVRKTKPKDKPYKLTDEKGLYLQVMPTGGKLWRMNYRHDGKQKTVSFGAYPDVSLAQAREKRDEVRKKLADGIDPMAERAARKAARLADAEMFEVVAREWFGKQAPTWAQGHAERVMARMVRDLFPWLANRPIAEITPPELLMVLRRVEDRGAVETAHRLLQNCGQVFRYAVATARAPRDITADLKGALPPVKGGHFAAVVDPKQAGELLRAMDAYEGTLPVKCALKLAPQVFVRPGELRRAEWKDIDFEQEEWRFLVTKTDTQHVVPLSRQAVEILRELHPLTGHGRYVFPSARTPDGSRPMSDVALLAALRRMGIDKDTQTVHGFRALARTVLDEVLGFRPDFVEHQLAHAVRDPNGRAYNRTAHLPERRRMMQHWADYLDSLKNGAEVIPFRKASA